jgi:ribosomal protein L37AE/L43A
MPIIGINKKKKVRNKMIIDHSLPTCDLCGKRMHERSIAYQCGFALCQACDGKYDDQELKEKKESEIMTNIRPQSKVSIILQMISRPNGASISEMMEATVSSSMRIRAMISELRMRHIRIITKDANSERILSTVYVRENI